VYQQVPRDSGYPIQHQVILRLNSFNNNAGKALEEDKRVQRKITPKQLEVGMNQRKDSS